MKPIIGITSLLEVKPKKEYSVLSQHYVESVIMAGGMPVIIPNGINLEDIDTMLESFDGLVLSGGEDIAPFIYGEDPIKEVSYISPDRDYFEIELVKKAVERKMPVLGICRGMQVINVALGGTLYQDIHRQLADEIGHLPLEMEVDRLYHRIEIKEDSKLYDIFHEKKMLVNSFHHQAVKDLGEGLFPTAFAADGLIEAFEHEKYENIIGIQCHPEDLTKKYAQFVELFKFVVEDARK